MATENRPPPDPPLDELELRRIQIQAEELAKEVEEAEKEGAK